MDVFRKGVIVIEKELYDEDKLMELLMQTPCEDFVTESEVYEIYTQPDDDFLGTKKILEDAGYQFLSAEEEMIPSNYSGIQDQETVKRCKNYLICSRMMMMSRTYIIIGTKNDGKEIV